MTGRQGSRPVRSFYQGGWDEKAQWVRLQRLRNLESIRYSPSLQPEFILVRELRLSWASFYLELWVPVSERFERQKMTDGQTCALDDLFHGAATSLVTPYTSVLKG
jgi:hypothetical protein